MDNLIEIRIDSVRHAAGYKCEDCGTFNRLFITTNSLDDAVEKLERYEPGHKQFMWHFGKTLKKALGLQKG
jgi:hypothetical protein